MNYNKAQRKLQLSR